MSPPNMVAPTLPRTPEAVYYRDGDLEKAQLREAAQTISPMIKGSKELVVRSEEIHPSINSSPVPTSPVAPYPIASPSTVVPSRTLLQRFRTGATAYKFLLTAVVGGNICALVLLNVCKPQILDARIALIAVAANVFTAALLRQEDVLNIMYIMCTRAPTSVPFAIRKHLANFHHFGGIHSACGSSALGWYVAYNVLVTRAVSEENHWSGLHVVETTIRSLIIICLTSIIVSSLPAFRRRNHNIFERIHRFAGWASVIALWIHTIIGAVDPDHGVKLYKDPSFYLLLGITFLLILPWLRIRRIPVHIEPMSLDEVRLVFRYKDMPSTATMKFSTSPLIEWHAFATIPDRSDVQHYSRILISNGGDWTKAIIQNPPSHLWIRAPTTFNFLRGVRMFNRVLIVATGSGIGPNLSLLGPLATPTRRKPDLVKVLWVARRPHSEHWGFAVNTIRAVDPEPNIIDSRATGIGARPDLLVEVKHMVDRFGIEAVFVVSKKQTTDQVVNLVNSWDSGVFGKGRRIAAYGAVFDS